MEAQLNQDGVCTSGRFATLGIDVPHFFKGTITGRSLLELQNYIVPGLEMHCDDFNELYFQQGRAPANNAVTARNYVNEVSADRVIWRIVSDKWPPESSNFTVMELLS
jgi:hypothetical protein